MTSYSKALFRRSPAAARELRLHQLATYRSGETPRNWTALQLQSMQGQPVSNTFGKRIPSGLQACVALCGHPACSQGCTLIQQHGATPQCGDWECTNSDCRR